MSKIWSSQDESDMHSTQYNDTRETHKDGDVTVVVNYFTL